MPGFKKMIETAMSANMQAMQSMQSVDWSEFTGQGYPVQMPAAAGASPSPAPGAEPAQDTAERLKRLDKLLEQGLVTAEEHRRAAAEDHRRDLGKKRTVHPPSKRSPGRARQSWTPIRLPRGA